MDDGEGGQDREGREEAREKEGESGVEAAAVGDEGGKVEKGEIGLPAGERGAMVAQ